MILFVLKELRFDADYLIEGQIDGFDNKVKLSYETRIAVFEGDEYLTSVMDKRPKFHLYKPHIAVITGISWEKSIAYPTVEMYNKQFEIFTQLMEVQGRLIYFEGDENLKLIAKNFRRDIVPFSYRTPEFEIINGITFLKNKKGNVPLKISGEQNLQYLTAARLACRQIGIYDEQFYSVIQNFSIV